MPTMLRQRTMATRSVLSAFSPRERKSKLPFYPGRANKGTALVLAR